ncbi:hypothetical protein MA03_06740 [Infirmifilum uzonense]|uniref:Uncharacterized protein n=1 Tax=Infirmifilum uzonense TaxID=1550241 RepID=A0A0F7FI46_9CREN|nr:hypothetical protein MA03_06740 [Infirmifilum uzonense]
MNIARKAGYTPPTPSKIETYIPTHQGVTPLTEKKDKIRPPGQRITPRRSNREPAPNGAGRLLDQRKVLDNMNARLGTLEEYRSRIEGPSRGLEILP